MKHIAVIVPATREGDTLCGVRVPFGEWLAGAAYEGMHILGGEASDFCAECQREWLRLRNTRG